MALSIYVNGQDTSLDNRHKGSWLLVGDMGGYLVVFDRIDEIPGSPTCQPTRGSEST